jgi:histidine triad (HIT) family protein
MSILFRLGSSFVGRALVGWFFAYFSFLLPVKRLYQSDQVLAFWHPNPDYAVHVLIIPKKALRDLDDLRADDAGILIEILQIAHKLAQQLGLIESGYRLVYNGGAYQFVPQMHFHLIPALAPGT